MITALLLPLAALLQEPMLVPGPIPGGLSYGIILYGEPTVTDLVPAHGVPVRPDAVIAEQRVEIMGRRMGLDRAVHIGAPFDFTYPAGTPVRLYRRPEGDRWCKVGIPGVSYTPPEDDHREIFPGLCLIDGDGDGAFERVLMLPYSPGVAPRELAIAPVRLGPAPDAADPRLSRRHVYRRLRIAETAERELVVVIEHAQGRPGEPPNYDRDPPAHRVALALHAGASASVAGVALRVAGGPGSWRLEASGGLAPWVVLERGGAAVRFGPYYLPERID